MPSLDLIFKIPCHRWRFRSRARFIFLGLLLGTLLLSLPTQAQDPTEVLIINSYHPGYAWSDGEQRGVLRALTRQHPRMLPAIEYLDWKRYPTADAEQQFIKLMRLKYGGQKLKAVITLDDKALQLVLENRQLFGGSQVPVIFGGVNYFTPELLHSQTNITGAAETKDIAGTLNLILRLQPDVEEIVGYNDDTQSSLANRHALEEGMRQFAPGKKLRFIEHWSVAELFHALSHLGPHTAVIGLGASRDRTGRLLADDMNFLTSVTSNCPVPIYIISEPILPSFSTGDWNTAAWTGIGGALVFSDKHGELVGGMANRVLAGTPAADIPIVTNANARLAVDWPQMKRFDFSASALPPGTKIFNQPDSFYRVNRSKIILVFSILALLAGTVVVLVVNTILRRRAERENRQLAAAAHQSSELIVTLDNSGSVKFVNPAFLKITGRSIAPPTGPEFVSTILGVKGGFSEIVEKLENCPAWSSRAHFSHPDGNIRQLSLAASAIKDSKAGIAGYLMIGRDVTREIRLEEQVREAQKTEAVGRLAGGVAHDFNNLLQIISGHAQFALEPQTSEAERAECLDQVMQASNRAAQLTQQLLAFGRRQPLQRTDTDLHEVVSRHLKMIRRVIGENLTVNFFPAKELWNVCVDQGQIEQVLLNICVNSRDAMPDGGQLSISLENVQLDPAFCHAHSWARPGSFVMLTTSDTGCGMDKSTLSRIFDPFFTTKPKSKGSGLGLSVVQGIVHQHEGFINVYSEPKWGTTFKIYFPAADPKARPASSPIPPPKAPAASGTILVVEDEADVRNLTSRILVRAGYEVMTAVNGAEAVQLFQTQAQKIRLVLLDVIMPVMNGPEACRQIRAIKPDVPVLFCSGYSAESIDYHFEFSQTLQLIQKPCNPTHLLDRIAEMLHGKSEPAATFTKTVSADS